MNLDRLNKAKKMHTDVLAVKSINKFIATGLPRGKALELLGDFVKFFEENEFLSAKQRQVIKNIKKDYEDYDYEKKLRDAVVTLLNEDKTPPTAETFIRDVVEQFDETNRFFPEQREKFIQLYERSTRKETVDD